MKIIKFYLKIIPDQLLWFLALIIVRFIKKSKSESVLIIPAADLNGGFGDDIMTFSLVSNFCVAKDVTIMTANVIDRNDFLKNERIRYCGGFKELNYLKILNVLKGHSQVFVIGADIMDGTYGYFPTVVRLRVMKLASFLGLGCKFTGFSISNRILPSIKREMAKTSELVKVKARDIDSFERLNEFIPAERLVLTNDIAFICPDDPQTYLSAEFVAYKSWCEARAAKKIVAVCPNSIQANKIGLEKYLKGFKLLLAEFVKRDDLSFVFLFHDLRPLCGKDNDRSISKKMYDHCLENEIECFFPESLSNGVSLKAYLSLVDFTVTGRMHLGISGAVSGKAMFGVCYANKFEGMLKLFEINPENNLIDYTALEDGAKVVSLFLEELEDSKNKIEKYLPLVKHQCMLNGIQ